MVAVLDELELTELATSIDGLVPGRCRGDPGRDRRPAPVHHRPGAGQARRPGAAREAVRHLHRPDQAHRPGPPTAAGRGLAGGLGRAADQPRLRRPLPAPDHPRAQQAQAHPGPDRGRRRDPAPAARRGHHRPSLGPRHRHPRHQAQTAVHPRRLSIIAPGGGTTSCGRGEPSAALRTPGYLAAHHRQPRPSSTQPDHTLPGTNPDYRYAGTDDGRGTGQTLDAKRLTLMVGRPPRQRQMSASQGNPRFGV